MMNDLLQKFAAEYAGAAGTLVGHLDREDADTAVILAHSVKVAAASLGMTEVSERAAALEVQIERDRTGDAALIADFDAALRAAVTAIERHLGG